MFARTAAIDCTGSCVSYGAPGACERSRVKQAPTNQLSQTFELCGYSQNSLNDVSSLSTLLHAAIVQQRRNHGLEGESNNTCVRWSRLWHGISGHALILDTLSVQSNAGISNEIS